MTSIHPSRYTGWSVAAIAFAAAALSNSAPAQTAQAVPAQLESVVVSAARTPQSPDSTPSSVSMLLLGDLATSQVTDLRTALLESPGVYIANTGAAGSQSSIFMRGASSHQTLFVVDGVRMNTRSAAYQNFLGGADLSGIDRIEVLRGAQSTLYGSSAMGGVVLIDTAHGCNTPTGNLEFTAGSFDTFGGSASSQGGCARGGYSASVSRYTTDNDRENNSFKQWSYSARVEGLPTDYLLVGATVRKQDGDYDEPGSRLWPSQAAVESKNTLVTAYVQAKAGKIFNSRLTTAWHRREYTYTDSWSHSFNENTRRYADWQNTLKASGNTELVAGLTREEADYKIASEKTADHSTAYYLSALSQPVKELTVTAGVRHDRFSTFSGANTWRAGAAYRIRATGTTLRANYGTGFTAPGSDDRYGVASWGQVGNPNLLAERSRGWDLGITQALLKGNLNVGLTYFDTEYRNLFEWEYINFITYQGRTINRAKADIRGLESFFDAKLNSSLRLHGSYTYLDAKDDGSKERLVRRPRHVGSAELRYSPAKEWVLGTGVRVVSDRVDSGAKMEDYSTVRLFARYEVMKNLSLKARVENLLDERYEEVLGYPALPVGVYGSVEWSF
jgi:vitamin B12 transporter